MSIFQGIILSFDGLGKNPITNVDPSTFIPLLDASAGNSMYAKDSGHVYFNTWSHGEGAPESFIVVIGADPNTFLVISGNKQYDAQDKNHKYQYGKIVQ